MILNKFPCRVGVPEQRKCQTKQEALERINRNNGVTDVYATLYNGSVDKIVWDFDVAPDDKTRYSTFEDALSDFQKMTEFFEDRGWSQMSVFSGGGLHKYLKTVDAKLQNPRVAIREVQRKYQDQLELKTDEAIFGDVERVFRVPNTWHPRAERFCVPLRHEEVFYEPEDIFELAQSQRFGINAITEGEGYPILKHDRAASSIPSFQTGDQISGNFNPAEVEPEEVVFRIYPCISNLLKNWRTMDTRGHGLGWRRRFLTILHLKEKGHTYQETVAILKKYLGDEEFHHCVYDEKQVAQIYKRDDLIFPRCNQLMTEVPCIHRDNRPCEDKDTLYQ